MRLKASLYHRTMHLPKLPKSLTLFAFRRCKLRKRLLKLQNQVLVDKNQVPVLYNQVLVLSNQDLILQFFRILLQLFLAGLQISFALRRFYQVKAAIDRNMFISSSIISCG